LEGALVEHIPLSRNRKKKHMLDHVSVNTAIVRVEDFYNPAAVDVSVHPAAVDVSVENAH